MIGFLGGPAGLQRGNFNRLLSVREVLATPHLCFVWFYVGFVHRMVASDTVRVLRLHALVLQRRFLEAEVFDLQLRFPLFRGLGSGNAAVEVSGESPRHPIISGGRGGGISPDSCR